MSAYTTFLTKAWEIFNFHENTTVSVST